MFHRVPVFIFIIFELLTCGCTQQLPQNSQQQKNSIANVCPEITVIKHGSAKCDSGFCRFSCDEGFTILKIEELTCENGKWNPAVPECVAVEPEPEINYCPSLERPDNVIWDGPCRKALIGEKCFFKCDKNLRLDGKDELICTATLEWNGVVPNCKKNPEDYPNDCASIKKQIPSSQTDIYSIWPRNMNTSIEVRCDMTTDNGGWTVFQRRGSYDVTENFSRPREDYVKGFGNLEQEYWLGLDAIHAMSSYEPQILRVDLEDFEGKSKHAKYDTFGVASWRDSYSLQAKNYSGDAGDSFAPRSNAISWNDEGVVYCLASQNCWWNHGSSSSSNLNGKNLRGLQKGMFEGIIWSTFRGDMYSLKSTEMKMRPRNFSIFVKVVGK